MLKSRHVPWSHPFVTNPTQRQLREGTGTAPVPGDLILNKDRNFSPWKDNSEIRVAQHHPKNSLDEWGLRFSLEACEECRFVEASKYSSMPVLSEPSILCRRNYWDLYQSHRGEIFLLSQKLGQVEGHCRYFAFPTGAGEVLQESWRFTGWAWRGPGRVVRKKAFLHDPMPALN